MDSSVSSKDEIWFLRVRHHVSDPVYSIYGNSSRQASNWLVFEQWGINLGCEMPFLEFWHAADVVILL
jgi:hypothetical protein